MTWVFQYFFVPIFDCVPFRNRLRSRRPRLTGLIRGNRIRNVKPSDPASVSCRSCYPAGARPVVAPVQTVGGRMTVDFRVGRQAGPTEVELLRRWRWRQRRWRRRRQRRSSRRREFSGTKLAAGVPAAEQGEGGGGLDGVDELCSFISL